MTEGKIVEWLKPAIQLPARESVRWSNRTRQTWMMEPFQEGFLALVGCQQENQLRGRNNRPDRRNEARSPPPRAAS